MLVIARTDADAADSITSDRDPYDSGFITGERTKKVLPHPCGIEQAIGRGLAYAPYADLVWCETSTPDSELALPFCRCYPREVSGQLLAYNCSPSFNWQKNLGRQRPLPARSSSCRHGLQIPVYRGHPQHVFNMLDLRQACIRAGREGMKHYAEKVQQPEFAAAKDGYTFPHQQEVGTSVTSTKSPNYCLAARHPLPRYGFTEECVLIDARWCWANTGAWQDSSFMARHPVLTWWLDEEKKMPWPELLIPNQSPQGLDAQVWSISEVLRRSAL